MKTCSKCSWQNADGTKFCSSCGAVLIGITASTSPANGEVSQRHAKPLRHNRGSRITMLLLAGILVTGIATAGYFIFLRKDQGNVTLEDPNITLEDPVVRDTTVNIPESTLVEPVTQVVPPAPKVQEEPPVISQEEIESVKRRIQEFYAYEDEEDIANLLRYFRFPIDQYYEIYNVSYDQLHRMITDAFNGALYYHSIEINWKYSSIVKTTGSAYKVLIYAKYTSASEVDLEKKVRDIHLIILMNDLYEITSVYANK